jgi:endonuclease YncB( thermonuclease family)
MMKIRHFIFALLTSCACAAPAIADPCEGPLPSKGARFFGVVRYIGDGDSLCLGPKDRPEQWIEVRLADFYAPELREPGGVLAKKALEKLVLGKTLVCQAGRRSYDRVIGSCTLDGRPVGDWLRRSGVPEGGRGRSHGQ